MSPKPANRYEARTRVFKALAHPSRLYIVDALRHGEQCVCTLTDGIGADMSTVSRHLSVLKQAGVVADEKRGMQVYYRLTMSCVVGFMDCVGETVGERGEGVQSESSDSGDRVCPVPATCGKHGKGCR